MLDFRSVRQTSYILSRMDISDAEFDVIISESMDQLPSEYIERLDNVVVIYENDPSPAQREQLKLRCHQSLLGLYEGIPLTKRGNNYSLVLPDKITLFKNPLLAQSNNKAEFKANVKHTLWHEIAHYFGLNHDRIHALERRHDSG